MTESQYKTTLKGIEADLRVARRLGCKMVIKKLQQSKIKLLEKAVKPSRSEIVIHNGKYINFHNYY